MSTLSQILTDIEEENLDVFYGEYVYYISIFIEELGRLEGRQIEENEDLDTIIDAHLDKIISNIVKDKYIDDILFFMVFYFSKQLGKAFASLSEEEYLEIVNRDYEPFILSELIRCILKNLTVEDDELLVKIIDRIPFVYSIGITFVFHELLKIKGLSENVMLKLREVIVRNGGVDWEKNVSLCCVDGLIFDLTDLIVKFNEYVAYGKCKVESIDLYAVRSDAKELLGRLNDIDTFDFYCKTRQSKRLDALNFGT